MLQIENPPAKGKKKSVPYDPRDLIILTDRKREYAKVNRQLRSGAVKTGEVQMPYRAKWERARIENIYDLSNFLRELEDDLHATVIRGQPIDPDTEGRRILRRSLERPGRDGEIVPPTYKAAARQWVLIDGDKLPLPHGYDVRKNPQKCIHWYRRQLASVAPELAGVTCHAKLSSSAGIEHLRKGAGKARKLSAHLWFFLDRPYSDQELKRWAKRVNALWRGDEPGKKPLIDEKLFHPIQPHFTANPVFEEMANPLPGRSWLIEGERDALALDIPAEDEIAALAARSGSTGGSVPSGLDCQEYLDMIGDDGIYEGKEGFQDTIKMAAIMAVEEQGLALDIDATIAEIQDRVRRFRGKRPAGEIDRYASYAFIREKIDWTIGQLIVRQTKARQRLQGRETRADSGFFGLVEARKKLAKEVAGFVEDATAYLRLRAEHDHLKQQAYLKVDRELGHDDGTVEWLRERNMLRASERQRIKRKLAEQYGLKHFPERAPMMLLRVTQGVGKTRAVIDELARMQRGQFDFYAPSHNLLEQVRQDITGLRPILPVNLIRGRGRDDPEGRLLDLADELTRIIHTIRSLYGRTSIVFAISRRKACAGAAGSKRSSGGVCGGRGRARSGASAPRRSRHWTRETTKHSSQDRLIGTG